MTNIPVIRKKPVNVYLPDSVKFMLSVDYPENRSAGIREILEEFLDLLDNTIFVEDDDGRVTSTSLSPETINRMKKHSGLFFNGLSEFIRTAVLYHYIYTANKPKPARISGEDELKEYIEGVK